MFLNILNAKIVNDPTGNIQFTGETSEHFFYSIRGNTTSNVWFFKKSSSPSMGKEEDLAPEETITILDYLIQRYPYLSLMLLKTKNGYKKRVEEERRYTNLLLKTSLIDKTEALTHPIETFDKSTGNTIYTGVLKGPLYYSFSFGKNGSNIFLKANNSDMNKAEPCTPKEVLFILNDLIKKEPACANLYQSLIAKATTPQSRPVKMLSYKGISLLDKKDPKKGVRLTGETNQFYFRIDVEPTGFTYLKAKMSNMRNAEKMSIDETIALLPQIEAKEKNEGVRSNLRKVINELQKRYVSYDSEELNQSLMDTSFVGKTEVLEQPKEIRTSNSFGYIGFLKGHIFYHFHYGLQEFRVEKATNQEMKDAIPCSRDEVRFILKNLMEKYPKPESRKSYQELLDLAEHFWRYQDAQTRNRLIEEEFQKHPAFFLNDTELLAAFENINPVFYNDDQKKRHISFKIDGKLYHIAPDEETPVFALIDSKFKPMKSSVFIRFINLLPEDETGIQLIETLPVLYEKYKDTLPKKDFNWKLVQRVAAIKLAQSLTQEAVQQKQQVGAYPQLKKKDFRKTLPVRVAKGNTKFIEIVRKNMLERFHDE